MEPGTTAKVVLNTTKGPIELELWAQETPKACRNFLTHCSNGYYDGCEFFRVVPGFIVQSGDPTNTGFGGESIYGDLFEIETNSRLKFSRRGLVGLATSEGNKSKSRANGSQFFMTLNSTPELNGKATLFGQIVGDSIYNLLEIAESELGENEKPLYPPKILSTEVLVPYFSDLAVKPREKPGIEAEDSKKQKRLKTQKGKTKPRKKPAVSVSLGYDDFDDDLGDVGEFKIKPAPGLKDGKKEQKAKERVKKDKKMENQDITGKELRDEETAGTEEPSVLENPTETSVPSAETKESSGDSTENSISELQRLKQTLLQKQRQAVARPEPTVKKSLLQQQKEKYRKSKAGETDTLAMLAKFQSKLIGASTKNGLKEETGDSRDAGKSRETEEPAENSGSDSDAEFAEDTSFLSHSLDFRSNPANQIEETDDLITQDPLAVAQARQAKEEIYRRKR